MAPKRALFAAACRLAKKAERSAEAEALAEVGRKNVVFFPSVLSGNDLIERYKIMWGKETKAHPVSQVILGC